VVYEWVGVEVSIVSVGVEAPTIVVVETPTIVVVETLEIGSSKEALGVNASVLFTILRAWGAKKKI
jgi:hypothetical protein